MEQLFFTLDAKNPKKSFDFSESSRVLIKYIKIPFIAKSDYSKWIELLDGLQLIFKLSNPKDYSDKSYNISFTYPLITNENEYRSDLPSKELIFNFNFLFPEYAYVLFSSPIMTKSFGELEIELNQKNINTSIELEVYYEIYPELLSSYNKEITQEEFRIKTLGTKGLVKSAMSGIKNVSSEEKKKPGLMQRFGESMNEFKQFVESKYESLKESTENSEQTTQNTIDWSLPASSIAVGTRHPLNLVRNQIVSIFKRLGFAVAEGPEIEDDWHNFGAMNLPEDHPARDMQDTFYVHQNPSWLLRTHTSSVQARVMEHQKPPIRVICPGRVYRNETISARAHCFFHQVEGLYVDENVSFADLKQTLYFFVQEMFGKDVKVRFRPSYFPFTEPSAEMDISCLICGGDGCNVCKHTGWVEILGSGMVHPKVLENFGIDSNKYTGFAFGMGVERICQLKYRVNDLRLYSQNDVRFLKQFTGVV
jgi:phenylalanyl-tRNA synthetase alpha chain